MQVQMLKLSRPFGIISVLKSFKPISCILIHLEKDNVYVRSVPNVAVRGYSNAQYEPFPPFLYPQGDVARSE